MRQNSDTFDRYNQAPAKELRLVIEVGFDLPLYLSSHADIPSLPANAVLGCLQQTSSTSQRLIPDQGRAEIGSLSFAAIDHRGQLSYVLRDELENGSGFKGKTVRLYRGYRGMDWAEFRLEQTQVAEESISYDTGLYRVRCRDVQREMRKDLFVPRVTRLRADFPKGAATLPVFDTGAFQPNPHTAAYGDAPGQSVYYLRIKYQDGYEIVRATGKDGTNFTGVTRGLFGTLERDHTVPTENNAERGIEVEEYIYLEGPGPALAYSLLTGFIPGTSDILPDNWHLGIDPALVQLDQFENVGADWFQPGDYSKGKILRFDGLEKTDGKKFIEQEINLLLGAFMPVNAAGQLGFRRMAGVLASAGTVGTITSNDVVRAEPLDFDLAGVRNVFGIQWSWYEQPGFDPRFLRTTNFVDADSIALHDPAKPLNLKFRGLHNSRHTYTTLKHTFDALRDRYAGPPLRLPLDLVPSMNDLEVGDVLRVALPSIRDHSITGDKPLHWNFQTAGDSEGWAVKDGTLSVGGGVLAVTHTAQDPHIRRTLSAAEQFTGADLPYIRIRLRRTSAEPIPPGRTFYWRDAATSTYHSVNLDSEVGALNALPVNAWHEIVVDLSGEIDWTGEIIEFLRLDVGSNWVADWSFDVDYIRLLPDLNLDEYSLDRAMEVQRVRINQVSGRVSVDLFGSYQPAGYIPDQDASVSSSAELPDGWYSGAGTELTAAGLSVDASGFLTADGSLAGAAASRTVFYYLGDLTIPAGRTLTISDNVELRVMGVLQVDGAIIGTPTNTAGGFIGSSYGGDGRVVGGNTSYGGSRGERVIGRNAVLPPLAIDNDAGALTGMPADLRGSGGADGGASYYYLQGDASYEIAGLGGAGGDGGAGLVVVARGIAFGTSGYIDSSGADGSPGTQVAPHNIGGGSGGGGAPGGVVLLVDGTQNPLPVLNSGRIRACYGASPASPGLAGKDGGCLGPAAARVAFVPKSRSPYPDAEDPALDPELQQALDDIAAAEAELQDIGADGKLHSAEKKQVIREFSILQLQEPGVVADATALGITTEKTAFQNTLAALGVYLDALGPNPWDLVGTTTSVDRNQWNTQWQDVYDALRTLLNRINSENTSRADAAQAAADDAAADAIDALADLQDISADGVLHPSEKLQAIRERAQLSQERAGIVAQANDYGITAERDAYTSADDALTSYLGGLAPVWDDATQATPINRTTWDDTWQAVYDARQALLGEIAERAAQGIKQAGKGVNLMPGKYAGIGVHMGGSITDHFNVTTSRGSAVIDKVTSYQGGASLKLAATSADHYAWFAPTGTSYNIPLEAGRSYIVSGYVRCDQASRTGNLTVKTNDPAATAHITGFTTGGTTNVWERVWFVFTAPAGTTRGILRADCNDAGATMWFDALMVEEQVGKVATPSAWSLQGPSSPEDIDYTGDLDATRGADGSNLLVGVGSNQLENSSFRMGTEHWYYTQSGSMTDPVNKGIRGQSESWGWAPGTIYINQQGSVDTWSRWYVDEQTPVLGGQYYEFSAYISAHRCTCFVIINWYDANGAFISQHTGSPVTAQGSSLTPDEAQRSVYMGQAPSNAYYVRFGLNKNGTNAGEANSWLFATRCFMGRAHPGQTEPSAWADGHVGTTRVLGTIDENQRIIDQRNIPMVMSEVAAVNTSSVLTASDVGSTCTIDIAAHTVQFGGYTVNYNAGSLTGWGFNKKVFVYCDDEGFNGGSVIYGGSQVLSNTKANKARRLVGIITTPSDGGGSTSEPNPDLCVDYDTLLPDGRYLRHLQPGDLVECIDVATGARGLYPLLAMGQGVAECYALQTTEGAEVWQSKSTPMDLPDGTQARTPDMLGQPVYTLRDGVATLSTVSSLQPLGRRRVLKPDLGDRMFFAGVGAAHTIATHNGYYKP
ncbi:carbohydrate binding domain-containing protein [Microbulbifer sp. JSM ZJ756]|uniref:carbohydrate binding domain-containing protein n=1 Tax=Microbulbifer sp. JSM ZJ756 TaxID=3376191 RepID=UPI00378B04D3